MAPGPLQHLPAPCQSTGRATACPADECPVSCWGCQSRTYPETRLAAIACLCPSAPPAPLTPVQSSAEGQEQKTGWGPVAAVLPCGEECVLSEQPGRVPAKLSCLCARLSPPRCLPLSLSAAALHWEVICCFINYSHTMRPLWDPEQHTVEFRSNALTSAYPLPNKVPVSCIPAGPSPEPTRTSLAPCPPGMPGTPPGALSTAP